MWETDVSVFLFFRWDKIFTRAANEHAAETSDSPAGWLRQIMHVYINLSAVNITQMDTPLRTHPDKHTQNTLTRLNECVCVCVWGEVESPDDSCFLLKLPLCLCLPHTHLTHTHPTPRTHPHICTTSWPSSHTHSHNYFPSFPWFLIRAGSEVTVGVVIDVTHRRCTEEQLWDVNNVLSWNGMDQAEPQHDSLGCLLLLWPHCWSDA